MDSPGTDETIFFKMEHELLKCRLHIHIKQFHGSYFMNIKMCLEGESVVSPGKSIILCYYSS